MSSAPTRVVPARLRTIQRDFLTRRGGRTNIIRASTAVTYCPAYASAYKNDISQCPRVIDAEVLHGDEQAFWTERRSFYRGGASRSFYPIWDRQAQVLIQLTRAVARVPQEAAFRLFALGLKMTLLPRLMAGAELMLPAWLTMNAEGLLAEAGLQKDSPSPAGGSPSAAAAAAAAAAPTAGSAGQEVSAGADASVAAAQGKTNQTAEKPSAPDAAKAKPTADPKETDKKKK